jgi:hypothetical protein
MGKDDWKPYRTKQQHFTAAEVELITNGFAAGRPAKDVARELQCASRSIQARYKRMTDGPIPRNHSTYGEVKRPHKPAKQNLYRSDFEPT